MVFPDDAHLLFEIKLKSNFSDQLKKIVKRYMYTRVGYNLRYHATVCMPGFKPNHGL